ncbi:MAG: hypothetical protein ACFBSC_11395 [Microcoleaceae cyanobacterium]
MQLTDLALLASRKDDPEYAQLSGHVPKDLARRFRIICADEGLKISEGLEQAIEHWLMSKEQPEQAETSH